MDKIAKEDWALERYTPAQRRVWDEFVEGSRNGTFLFMRDYMDYHSDRFEDCSWIARRDGRIRAILPANITDDGTLHSHGGLTYGGWLLPQWHEDGADLLHLFAAALEHWRKEGIVRLDYKPVPYIYHSRPTQDDLYALFRLGASRTGCGLSATVDLTRGVHLNQMQRRHLKRAAGYDWRISEDSVVDPFMRMLEECLDRRHDVKPVHTAEELQMLRDRFPDRIRVFTLRIAGEDMPDAGVCVYDTGIVAHAQYIATTERGRALNLLTPLFHRLMTDVFAARRWFDFGISTEDNGSILNEGLLAQKYSYGGGGVTYDRFTLDLS